jgi:TolB-like protein/Flp pilus assembly protein TadD
MLFRGGEPIRLGRRAVVLLRTLIGRQGQPLSKDELIEAAWPSLRVEENNLTVQIAALRRALREEPGGERWIETLPRRGYRFIGPTAVEAAGVHGARAEANPALTIPDKPSIAVLPFQNMSGDPEQDYFADGVVEEIITALSRCNWLFVIARNSSFSYKGKSADVRQVGRELGVRYVLVGSVRRSRDRLRFTGQLVDATTGVHIWGDRFEGKMNDLFELQDSFTAGVVAAIEPRLELAEIARLKRKPAGNLDAYERLLRAQQLVHEFTRESLAAALHHLEQTLVIDPAYAPAMALASYCYAERNSQGWAQDPEAEAKHGLRLALRAVELNKDDANVFWMAAYAVWRLQTDAPRAREFAYRSLELNPNSAIALALAGRIEHSLGNGGKALELLGRAKRLSPCDPRAWIMTTGLAIAYFSEGRFYDALSAAKSALSENPRSIVALRISAATLAKLGRQSQAADAVRELLDIDPHMTISKVRAQKYYIEGAWWDEYLAALRLAGLPE